MVRGWNALHQWKKHGMNGECRYRPTLALHVFIASSRVLTCSAYATERYETDTTSRTSHRTNLLPNNNVIGVCWQTSHGHIPRFFRLSSFLFCHTLPILIRPSILGNGIGSPRKAAILERRLGHLRYQYRIGASCTQ